MSIKDLFIGADLTSVKSGYSTPRKTELISEDNKQKKPNEKQQRQDDSRGEK